MCEFLDRMIDRNMTSSGVIIIGTSDGITKCSARGAVGDVGSLDIDKNSIFRIYSMTKLVTSLVAARLVDSGVTNWNEDIGPTFGRGVMGVTLHHLLSHTSGLGGATARQSQSDPFIARGIYPYENRAGEIFTNASLANALLDTMGCPVPGSVWRYSRSHDLAGFFLAKKAKTSLPLLVEELVCKYLAISDLGFSVSSSDERRVVRPWSSVGLEPKGLWNGPPVIHSGGSGMYATGEAYFNLLAGILKKISDVSQNKYGSIRRIVADGIGDRANTAEDFIPGKGFGFGYGVAVKKSGGSIKDFWWLGRAGTSFYVSPEEGIIALAMMQNYGRARALQAEFYAELVNLGIISR